MNLHSSLRASAAFAMTAILAVACVGIESATPTPSVQPTSSAVTPTASPAPSSSPAPTPTPPTPTPAPTPTPTPAAPPLSAEEVVARLIAFSVSDETFALSMNGDYSGTLGGQDTFGSVEYSGDGSGQDFVGSSSLTGPGLTLTWDMVVIGDRLWVLPSGGAWIPGPRDETQPIQPVFDLAPEDVTYEETTHVNGEPGHRLTINRWTGGDLRSNGYRRVRITIVKYEVLVNHDAKPVEIELDYRVQARVGGLPMDADYFLHYLLSDFGKPVTIEPPI